MRRGFLTGSAFLLALCSLLATTPADAQDLLDFLFGPEQEAPAQRETRTPSGDVRFGPKRPAKKPAGGGGGGGRGATHAGGYCVRTCDGYFFPLIKSSRATRQQSCNFACPSATVEIFDGASIESARNSRGETYKALVESLAGRADASARCSCNDPSTSAAYSRDAARTDPTLQTGDFVIEDEGPLVFGRQGLVPLAEARFVAPRQRASVLGLMRRSGDLSPVAPAASASVPPAAAR
jgi:hypothetical protein